VHLTYLKRAITLRKSEVKRLREDSRTQYFMSIRLRESNKTLVEMKKIKADLQTKYVVLSYLKDRALEEEKILDEFSKGTASFVETSKAKMNSDSFTNNVLQELRNEFKRSNQLLAEIKTTRLIICNRLDIAGFRSVEKILQRFLDNLDRNEEQIIKVQADVLPFMQYDLSEFDEVKTEANKILNDCKNFLGKINENESLIYDFEDARGNANENNRLQQNLLKTFKTLEALKRRIKLDKVSKEISSLHRRVENEKSNFMALKSIFDNNAYFKMENYENISFYEK
jgi:hypothetical protein